MFPNFKILKYSMLKPVLNKFVKFQELWIIKSYNVLYNLLLIYKPLF